MSNLRTKLIRLAHENPELREHLLPMIKEAKLFKNKKEFQEQYPSLPRTLKPDVKLFLRSLGGRQDGDCPFCGSPDVDYDGNPGMDTLNCYNCYASWKIKTAVTGIGKIVVQPQPWGLSEMPKSGTPLEKAMSKGYEGGYKGKGDAPYGQSWAVLDMHASLKEGASQSPKETAKWSIDTLEEALGEMEAVVLTLGARGGSGDYEADASLADTYGDAQKAVTLIRKASAPLAMATKLLKRVK